MTNPKYFIAGFPYVRERYFSTFRHWQSKDELLFLLPEKWKVKKGKVIYDAPNDNNVIKTNAYFHHSGYPIIGGLLKGWMPSFPMHLWRNRKSIKLVYSCSEPTLLTTLYQGFFAKLMSKKHVIFSWENIAYDKKYSGLNLFFKRIILALNFWFADGLVCGNTKCVSVHKPYVDKPMDVIAMNGLDIDTFTPKPEPKKDEIITFLFVGAIDERKGLDVLVKAFNTVHEENPATRLHIVGSGDENHEKMLENLVQEKGLSEVVQRTSWVGQNELLELLTASDVFMYPSVSTKGWEEQFGYSMAEASLMELPVIATKTGSIDEVVLDSKTGILVPPKDTQSLAQAMLKLADDKDLRIQMGKSGREHIATNFSHQTIAEKFKTFFEKMLS